MTDTFGHFCDLKPISNQIQAKFEVLCCLDCSQALTTVEKRIFFKVSAYSFAMVNDNLSQIEIEAKLQLMIDGFRNPIDKSLR